MKFLKWAAIIAAAWLAFKWLSGAYDSSSVNLGGHTTGKWAPLITYGPESYAWAPPYGIPHEGGA
jgi:hypothetical protein